MNHLGRGRAGSVPTTQTRRSRPWWRTCHRSTAPLSTVPCPSQPCRFHCRSCQRGRRSDRPDLTDRRDQGCGVVVGHRAAGEAPPCVGAVPEGVPRGEPALRPGAGCGSCSSAAAMLRSRARTPAARATWPALACAPRQRTFAGLCDAPLPVCPRPAPRSLRSVTIAVRGSDLHSQGARPARWRVRGGTVRPAGFALLRAR